MGLDRHQDDQAGAGHGAAVELPSASVLEVLFERAPEIITITDAKGRQTMVNAAGLALLGFHESFRRPEDGEQFVHPDDLQRLRRHRSLVRTAVDRGEGTAGLPPLRYRVRAEGGAWRWLETLVADMHDVPEVQGNVAFSRDITEAEEQRQALVESETRLAALVESLREGAFVEDAHGTVVLANDHLAALFGLVADLGSVVGQPSGAVVDQLAGATDDADVLRNVHHDPLDHVEAELSLRAGSAVDLEVIRIRSDGDDVGRLWLFHDATARHEEARRQRALFELEHRARQAAELHAQQLEAYDRLRNDFVAGVSHELRTPLTVIASASQLLQAEVDPLTPDVRRHLEIIERNAERLRAMIEDLLVVGRLDAGVVVLDCRPMAPAAVLADVAAACDPAAAGRDVRVRVDADPSLTVCADARRVSQIAGNLLDNAIKFTEQGTEVVLSATADGSHWVLAVGDHGPGIPVDQRDAVFERFVRTPEADRSSTPGAGLGLAIVRGLAELHGGTVTIGEAEGGGAIVSCRLPLEPTETRAP